MTPTMVRKLISTSRLILPFDQESPRWSRESECTFMSSLTWIFICVERKSILACFIIRYTIPFDGKPLFVHDDPFRKGC